jgi:hypothetical protein
MREKAPGLAGYGDFSKATHGKKVFREPLGAGFPILYFA